MDRSAQAERQAGFRANNDRLAAGQQDLGCSGSGAGGGADSGSAPTSGNGSNCGPNGRARTHLRQVFTARGLALPGQTVRNDGCPLPVRKLEALQLQPHLGQAADAAGLLDLHHPAFHRGTTPDHHRCPGKDRLVQGGEKVVSGAVLLRVQGVQESNGEDGVGGHRDEPRFRFGF